MDKAEQEKLANKKWSNSNMKKVVEAIALLQKWLVKLTPDFNSSQCKTNKNNEITFVKSILALVTAFYLDPVLYFLSFSAFRSSFLFWSEIFFELAFSWQESRCIGERHGFGIFLLTKKENVSTHALSQDCKDLIHRNGGDFLCTTAMEAQIGVAWKCRAIVWGSSMKSQCMSRWKTQQISIHVDGSVVSQGKYNAANVVGLTTIQASGLFSTSFLWVNHNEFLWHPKTIVKLGGVTQFIPQHRQMRIQTAVDLAGSNFLAAHPQSVISQQKFHQPWVSCWTRWWVWEWSLQNIKETTMFLCWQEVNQKHDECAHLLESGCQYQNQWCPQNVLVAHHISCFFLEPFWQFCIFVMSGSSENAVAVVGKKMTQK